MQSYIGPPRRTLTQTSPSRQLRNRNPLDSHVSGLTLFLVPRLFPIQPFDQDVDGSLSEDRRQDLKPPFGEDRSPEGRRQDRVEGGESCCYRV